MKNKSLNQGDTAVRVVAHAIVVFIVVLCLLPFILIFSGSFTSNAAILQNGFHIIPTEFSLEAYQFVFKNPKSILNAYKMTLIVTTVGTAISIFLSTMAAFVLSRKEFKHRNKISFYLFFTTLFSGGLVPWYILCVRYLHFKELPYIALIAPMLFNYFYIIILRSFMSSIPEAIIDSARIDGADDFCIYWRMVLPLSKSAIATVVLFTAMGYWNDYYNPMLFVSDDKFVPLQYYLYKIISSMQGVTSQALSSGARVSYPSESFKMAMTVVAIGPILLVYPFIQKYLVRGVTIGAVKG